MRCELLPGHPDFVPLSSIAGLAVDLRYAGTDNFVGHDLYGGLDCAYVHREAGAALAQAVAWLHRQAPALRLRVLDALRPHRVQQQLWQHLEGTGLRQYVADPALGSIHSFGMAVDVTLQQPDGSEADMGSGFDEMDELSHPALEEVHLAAGRLSPAQRQRRELLRGAMAAGGFAGIPNEWWHFDLGDRARVRANYLRID